MSNEDLRESGNSPLRLWELEKQREIYLNHHQSLPWTCWSVWPWFGRMKWMAERRERCWSNQKYRPIAAIHFIDLSFLRSFEHSRTFSFLPQLLTYPTYFQYSTPYTSPTLLIPQRLSYLFPLPLFSLLSLLFIQENGPRNQTVRSIGSIA